LSNKACLARLKKEIQKMNFLVTGTEQIGIRVAKKKKVLKCNVPVFIPLHAPETKSTFLPLLHDYLH